MTSNQKTITYTHLRVSEMEGSEKNLYKQAVDAANDAYAPYSNFPVGAAVLLSDQTIVTGSNQENAAYPSGLCAERVALFYAGAKFSNKLVHTVLVYVPGKGQPASPCGSCLQVMAETEDRTKQPVRVLMSNDEWVIAVDSVDALLPFRFGKTDLLGLKA